MNKYKVYYEGFVYIEAYDESEAIDKAEDEFGVIYDEKAFTHAEEVDDFMIKI